MTLCRNAAMALMLALGAKAASAADETIRIGGIFSLTGPAAAFALPTRDSVQLILDDMNTKGGINGRKVEMFLCDDKTNPTETARCASDLIRQDNVVAIIGSSTGTGTLAMLPSAARAEVPILSPVSTIALTDPTNKNFKWVFRTSLNDKFMLNGMLDRLVFEPGYKRIAMLYSEDIYGQAGLKIATERAGEHGAEIVGAVSAASTALDLTPAATKLRGTDPDVVILQAWSPAMGAAFMRAARQVGLNVPIVASASLGQKSFLDAAGDAANGIQLVSLSSWDEPTAKQEELGKLIDAAGKKRTGFGDFLGSSSMIILAQAIGKVDGEVTGAKIRDAMETICDFGDTYMNEKVCYSADNHEGLNGDGLVRFEARDGKFMKVN